MCSVTQEVPVRCVMLSDSGVWSGYEASTLQNFERV